VTTEVSLPGEPESAPRTPEVAARLAWLILGVASFFSLLLCLLVGYGLWRFRAFLMLPQHDNKLEAYVESVSLSHAGEVLPIAVSTEQPQPLREGETVQVGKSPRPGAAALVTLWDDSTLQIYADTRVVFHRLRGTRYSTRRQQVDLELSAGQVVLGVARLERYQQVDFVVRTPGGLIQLQPAGSYLLVVGQYTEVAVRKGEAEVLSEAEGPPTVVVAGQKAVVPAGEPIVVEPARWELLVNGDFDRGLEGWSFRSDQTEDGGTVDAKFLLEQQQVGEEQVWVVGLERLGGIEDRCQAILSQEVDQDLSPYQLLNLEFDLRINYQGLPYAGPTGEDYPFIARIRYLDADGESRRYFYGFYYRAEVETEVEPKNGQAILFPHYRWEHVSLDLSGLRPRLVFLEGVDLMASGQDYRSWVTNVSLIAQ
jgi:hypothetical protein